MNTVIWRIYCFVLLVLLFVHKTHAEEYNVKIQELYDHFATPREFYKPEIDLVMRRILWLKNIVDSDDWRKIVHHPGKKEDWNKANVSFFINIEKNKVPFVNAMSVNRGYDNGGFSADDDIGFHPEIGIVFYDCLYYRFEIDFNADLSKKTYCFLFNSKKYTTSVESSDDEFVPAVVSCIEWNEDAKITYDSYKEKGESFWDDIDVANEFLEELKREPTHEPVIALFPDKAYQIQTPNRTKNPEVEKSLKRLSNYYSILRSGSIKNLAFYDVPGHQISIQLRFNEKGTIQFFLSENMERSEGVFFTFDDQKRITSVIEGEIERDDSDTETEKYILNKESKKKGIEVKYHPNGYPASYRTIVKNRLFGPQCKWSEKGEVIEFEDLDIPKPIPEPDETPVEKDTKGFRIWTSANGKQTVKAKLISVADGKAVLENESGKRATMETEKLSESDRKYLEQIKIGGHSVP